jgi:hypothetical protein
MIAMMVTIEALQQAPRTGEDQHSFSLQHRENQSSPPAVFVLSDVW